jgi:hypothetical protein
MTPMTDRTLEPVARGGTVGRGEGAVDPRLTGAIARVKQGDVSALHYIYVRYADDVCGDVESIVRDRNEAEDTTQNLFTKLITANQGGTSSARFRSWHGSSAWPGTLRSTTCAPAGWSPATRSARTTSLMRSSGSSATNRSGRRSSGYKPSSARCSCCAISGASRRGKSPRG